MRRKAPSLQMSDSHIGTELKLLIREFNGKLPETPKINEPLLIRRLMKIIRKIKQEQFANGFVKGKANAQIEIPAINWRDPKKELPKCEDWDADREAHYSKKVLTYSRIHGLRETFGRLDDIIADGLMISNRHRQRGRTFKWGVNGNDHTVDMWIYCSEIIPKLK